MLFVRQISKPDTKTTNLLTAVTRITLTKTTLVDEVEESLIRYFTDRSYTIGSTLPTENELVHFDRLS